MYDIAIDRRLLAKLERKNGAGIHTSDVERAVRQMMFEGKVQTRWGKKHQQTVVLDDCPAIFIMYELVRISERDTIAVREARYSR